jgi:sialidase-1
MQIRAARRLRRTSALVALTLIALVAIPVAVAGPAEAAVPICHSTPFRSSPSHHYWYRIPSIAKSNGTVVYAFAERRDNITSDTGNFDLVMVRSTDAGCHWTAPRTIFNHRSDRVSNPTSVVASNGRVFVFASARFPYNGTLRNNLYVMSSEDGFASRKFLNFAFSAGLPGPGHGITLNYGPHKGRMIIPLSYVDHSGRYGVVLAHSDDLGKTWTPGRELAAPAGVKLIEPSLAERKNGGILVSLRDSTLVGGKYKSAGHTRWYTISTDGGLTMSSMSSGHAPKIVSVEASMLVPTGEHSNELYFVAPAQVTAGRPDVRRDESVWVSTNGGASWGRPYNLESSNNPGAYSDIAQLDAATLGIVYEGGTRSYKEVIKFVSIRTWTP